MNRRTKKTLAALAVLAFSVTSMTACGSGSEAVPDTTIAASKGKGLCDIVTNKKQKRKCNRVGKKIEKGANDAWDKTKKAADDSVK